VGSVEIGQRWAHLDAFVPLDERLAFVLWELNDLDVCVRPSAKRNVPTYLRVSVFAG
jgi:hypothetical protein